MSNKSNYGLVMVSYYGNVISKFCNYTKLNYRALIRKSVSMLRPIALHGNGACHRMRKFTVVIKRRVCLYFHRLLTIYLIINSVSTNSGFLISAGISIWRHVIGIRCRSDVIRHASITRELSKHGGE